MSKPQHIALVTGGARRIGAAIALDLAAHGFGVVIHCNRSRAEADALAASIEAKGGTASVVQANLGDESQASDLIAKAEASLGPVSLLINNASIFEDDSAETFTAAGWARHFALHVTAPALLTRAMAAALPAGVPGLVVNIVDQRVWRLTPRYFSYTLSKSAQWTATQTMALSFAPRLRVNAIGPGPTLPNSRQSMADFEAQVQQLILEKGPVLDDFGRTIRFLWDTPSITGQMIAIDGGQHLAWETPDVTGIVE